MSRMDRPQPRGDAGIQTGREISVAGSAGRGRSGAATAEQPRAVTDGRWSEGAWRLAWTGVEIRERRRWAREWSTS